MWTRLLIITPLLMCCVETPVPPEDQSLKKAIKSGAWPTPSHSNRAADPLSLLPEDIISTLGSFKYTENSNYKYIGPMGTEGHVENSTSLTMNKRGYFELQGNRTYSAPNRTSTTRSHHIIFFDGQLFLRINDGAWIENDLFHRGQTPWLKRTLNAFPAILAALGPHVTTASSGHHIKLSMSANAKPKLSPDTSPDEALWSEGGTWNKWWQVTHHPQSISGHIELHQTTGTIKSASLKVVARTQKTAVPSKALWPHGQLEKDTLFPGPTDATFEGAISIQLMPLSEAPQITRPASSIHSIRRPRIHHMIKQILSPKSP